MWQQRSFFKGNATYFFFVIYSNSKNMPNGFVECPLFNRLIPNLQFIEMNFGMEQYFQEEAISCYNMLGESDFKPAIVISSKEVMAKCIMFDPNGKHDTFYFLPYRG